MSSGLLVDLVNLNGQKVGIQDSDGHRRKCNTGDHIRFERLKQENRGR